MVTDNSNFQSGEVFVSYAQNGEDIRLFRALQAINTGSYVEVGGWHPRTDSVSRAFYDRGWSGLVIEPSREMALEFGRDRPRDRVINSAAGSTIGEVDFFHFPGDYSGRSTTVAHVARDFEGPSCHATHTRVPLTTLTKEIEDWGASTIHFLTIDVEGSECDVLDGMDLTRFRPWILVIEATRPGSMEPSYDSWEEQVVQSGYLFTTFDGLNRYYVAREHSELLADVALPPNVYDNFEAAKLYDLKGELIANVQSSEEMSQALTDKDTYITTLENALTTKQQQLENTHTATTQALTDKDTYITSLENALTTKQQQLENTHTAFHQLSAQFRMLENRRSLRFANWAIRWRGRVFKRST